MYQSTLIYRIVINPLHYRPLECVNLANSTPLRRRHILFFEYTSAKFVQLITGDIPNQPYKRDTRRDNSVIIQKQLVTDACVCKNPHKHRFETIRDEQ